MNRDNIEKRDQKEKVQALYKAVGELLAEHVDLNRLKVEDITQRAGIGKGTAYEYFESKEDIIVNAILYISKKIFDDLQKEIQQYSTFKEKVYSCFIILESGFMKSECLFRILHMLFGLDAISTQLRTYMENDLEMGPYKIIKYMVDCGKKEEVLREDLPQSYLAVTLATKLLAYLFYLTNDQIVPEADRNTMKDMIYEGILRELGVQSEK